MSYKIISVFALLSYQSSLIFAKRIQHCALCLFVNGIYIDTNIYHLLWHQYWITVYPKKYAHGFVMLCFVVVMHSFIMNSHEVFIHINQGCFAGTGAIVRLPQCQWSKPDGYGKISQCITTTKRSKAKTVCIFLGIYCMSSFLLYGSRFRHWATIAIVVGQWASHGMILMD